MTLLGLIQCLMMSSRLVFFLSFLCPNQSVSSSPHGQMSVASPDMACSHNQVSKCASPSINEENFLQKPS